MLANRSKSNVPSLRSALVCVLTLLAAASAGRAQASFHESFDALGATDLSGPGPQVLVSQGWLFRNQSQPRATPAFFRGILPSDNPVYFGPQAGAGYLAGNKWGTDVHTGTLSNWAILPALAGQQAGDVITLWARSLVGTGQLEIRYSPSGGTSTGSSVTSVGDFDTLLLDINPAPASGWTRFVVAIPGAGRIAIRHRGVVEIGGDDPYVGIDSLSVGEPPAPQCNLPPVPQPGETVSWTAAAGPYRLCKNVTIPSGATVVVEPGVVLDIDLGRQLGVVGTLRIQGTAAAPAVVSATHVNPAPVAVIGGTLEAQHAAFNAPVSARNLADALLTDCSFGPQGSLTAGGEPGELPYVRLERCAFTDSELILAGCLATLRNNTFTNTYALALRSFVDVTAPNSFVGEPLRIVRESSDQPLPVNGVRGSGGSAGLVLDGGTYHIGPDSVFEGNQFPLELHGGLTPDSVVPASGNAHDAINVGDGSFAGRGRWPSLGLPYRITQPRSPAPGGHLTIDPGAVVEAAHPGAALWSVFTRQVVLDGLPEAPITFRGLDGQSWDGLAFHVNSTTGCRMEYCVVEDAAFGVVSSDNALYVDSCVFANNQVGANANTFGSLHMRKSRLMGNDVALSFTDLGSPKLSSPTTPNSFEGNDVALDAMELGSDADARHVWWGDASGPLAPGNPGGRGDRIAGPGAGGVLYQPFLIAAPDHANTPPVVRMVEPGLTQRYASPDYIIPDYLFDRGTKYILRWDVASDDPISTQRIEFSPDGHFEGRFSVLVDDIPPDARTWELTIPDPGFAVSGQPQFLRVVAVDAAGQQAWDQAAIQVPSGRVQGALTITSDDFAGQTFYAGTPSTLPIQWSGGVDSGLISPVIVLESDGAAMLGYELSGEATFVGGFPFISTDRARLALQVTNNSNDIAWFFADGYFSIRHDPRMGLVPPAVTIDSTLDGASFHGGGIVPIRWTAEAPEGLRSFDVQASYDAGRTWHPVVRDLPATATSYNWRLPASAGIDEVRIRVVVRDQRFQNSSSRTPSGADVAIAVTPGEGGRCAADFNADGVVNSTDVSDFINAWFEDQSQGTLTTDWDRNGVVNSTDVSAFINDWFEDALGGQCG